MAADPHDDGQAAAARSAGPVGAEQLPGRQVFDIAPNAMLLLDQSGVIRDVNPAALRVLQYARSQLVGQPVEMLVPAALQAAHRGHRSDFLAAPRPRVMGSGLDLKAVRGDGVEIPVEVGLGPVQVDGQLAVVVSLIDISERVRAAAEIRMLHDRLQHRIEQQAATLAQSERDLQSILDAMPAMIGYWDANLRNRFGNRAYREWFGVDPQQMPGMHIRDVIGEQNYRLNLPYVLGALRGDEQFFERAMPQPDGVGVRHSQTQYVPDRAEDGRVRGFYVLALDVTPIKEAQARASDLLRFNEAVIQSTSVGIGVFRADGSCVLANSALAELFGVARDVVLKGRATDLAAWSESDLATIAAATLEDGVSRRCELHLRAVTGREVWAQCALSAIERGGKRHLLVMAHDATEQRAAHEALLAAREAAEAASRTKSAFLANMSHEIRTPMNAIVGLSRLALEGELEPRARDYLDKVHNSAVALMGILDDVLDYSKIEAGQMRFESIEFDLDDLLQRVADLFSARVEQKGLEFVFEVDPDVPLLLRGDPLRLSQVINNLVGNAVKFTERGSVYVGVSLDERLGEECRLRFRVRDTGMGISSGRLGSLFDPFNQADNSITRRFGGSGLGLTISRRLVRQMDGDIAVSSEPGRGSEFSFTVKLGEADDAERVHDLHQVAGLRVLVVEDCSLTARVIVSQLQAWRLMADRVSDGFAALERVAAAERTGRPYDVVLLDWQMPGLDGIQVLRTLRARARAGQLAQMPVVVMMTAFGRDAVLTAAESERPDAVLSKPLLIPPLFDALIQARQGRSVSAPTVPAQSESLLSRAAPLRDLHVLLAEDNEVNQIVACEFLNRLGVEVTVVPDGRAAVATVQAHGPGSFAAVLMDLHMPVMDGFEATGRIRSLPGAERLPVIAMSAAALPEDRARCFEAGMVDHVAKPVMPERLVEVLLRWTRPSALVAISAPAPFDALPAQRPYELAPALATAESGGLHGESWEEGAPATRAPGPAAQPADGPGASTVRSRGSVPPTLPGFDLPGLYARIHGNESLALALLGEYRRTESGSGEALADLIAAGRRQEARERLHQLKGVSANVGAVAVAQACSALQGPLRDGADVGPELQALRSVLDTTMAALQGLLERDGRQPG